MGIFNRKEKKEKKLKEEYREKLLSQNKQEETTKINLSQFNIEKSQSDLSYERFNSLTTKDLKYKLENESLNNQEKEIIRKIINERKK